MNFCGVGIVLQIYFSWFRDYPILWHVRNPEYKLRNKKQDAWNQIAFVIKLDRSEVEKKFGCPIGQ